MENPTPFDLNEAIHRWQQQLATSPAFKADNLEELASHLRSSVQKFKATGLSEMESFLIASWRLGRANELNGEFTKLNRGLVWRAHAFWMLAGMLVYSTALELAQLISKPIMVMSSHFITNGKLLGWIGAASYFAVIVALAFLFDLIASGRLTGFTASAARLLQRRTLAITVLFCGVLALKALDLGGTMLFARGINISKFAQAYQIEYSMIYFGGVAVMMVIVVALTKPALGTGKEAISVQVAGTGNPQIKW